MLSQTTPPFPHEPKIGSCFARRTLLDQSAKFARGEIVDQSGADARPRIDPSRAPFRFRTRDRG